MKDLQLIIFIAVFSFCSTQVLGQDIERNQRFETETVLPNIIRLHPIAAFDVSGAGPGISYERLISKDKKVSIIIPFSLILSSGGSLNNGGDVNYIPYIYLSPGLKFYPFGHRPISYAFGPNLFFGYGNGTVRQNFQVYEGYNVYQAIKNVQKTELRAGFMIENYINFQITPHFNMGAELGVGVRYLHQTELKSNNSTDKRTKSIAASGAISFQMGYCF